MAIGEKYDFKIDNFASLVDGKAMWCLLDYYFRKELHCSCSYKDSSESSGRESTVSTADNTNAVHNFILSQKMTTLLGNFPEVLQISDILEHNGPCNDRSVVILLVFLSSQLIVKKKRDQLNFHKFLGCNCQSPDRMRSSMERWILTSKAAPNQEEIGSHSADALRKFKAIQSWWQEMAERNYKCDTKPAASSLQCFLTSKHSIKIQREKAVKVIQSHFRQCIERCKYIKIKNAVSLLQTVIRTWLAVRQKSRSTNSTLLELKRFQVSHCRGWLLRRDFLLKRGAAIKIQSARRCQKQQKAFHCYRNAAIQIQRFVRGQRTRSRLLGASCCHAGTSECIFQTSSGCFQSFELKILLHSVLKLQRWWRDVLLLKLKKKSVMVIQSHTRGWIARRKATRERHRIVVIQVAIILEGLPCTERVKSTAT